MSRLLEAISLSEGRFNNLGYHQQRINESCQTLFGQPPSWKLEAFLNLQNVPPRGLMKCRILYDRAKAAATFIPYAMRPMRTLKLIEDNHIQYAHKFADRSVLDGHFANRGPHDDILIVKNGLVTDTSVANIVFRKGEDWTTPVSCLLKGTMRQYLLDEGLIREARVTVDDITDYEQFRLINALLGWDAAASDVSNIN